MVTANFSAKYADLVEKPENRFAMKDQAAFYSTQLKNRRVDLKGVSLQSLYGHDDINWFVFLTFRGEHSDSEDRKYLDIGLDSFSSQSAEQSADSPIVHELSASFLVNVNRP